MNQAVRHGSMRARNLAVVLSEIGRGQALSRAALAEITGLTKTTVSKLVGDLIDGGMAIETGAVRDGERGRPGVAVQLSGRRVAALGLEINVDYLAGCVVDLTRTVRIRRTQAVDNRAASAAEVIGRLGALATSLVADAADLGLSVAEGVLAIPGPIDPASGVVRNAPNLGWRDVAVPDFLDVPVRVRVDNEANLAALGELWFGAGPALGDFLFVSGEIGIGAGLVVGGTLFRGAQGFAGELGHVIVSPDGAPCRCGGTGCLEQYAGQDALLRATARGLPTPPVTSGAAPRGLPSPLPTPGVATPGLPTALATSRPASPGLMAPGLMAPGLIPLGLAALVPMLEAGDPAALDACRQAGAALGLALTSAVNLLDPDTIVLGGIFAPLFPWLSGPAKETMTQRLTQMRGGVPSLVASQAGPDAATLGAAGQVIEQIITDPAAFLTVAGTSHMPPALKRPDSQP